MNEHAAVGMDLPSSRLQQLPCHGQVVGRFRKLENHAVVRFHEQGRPERNPYCPLPSRKRQFTQQ